jgi:hypothetical protein
MRRKFPAVPLVTQYFSGTGWVSFGRRVGADPPGGVPVDLGEVPVKDRAEVVGVSQRRLSAARSQ